MPSTDLLIQDCLRVCGARSHIKAPDYNSRRTEVPANIPKHPRHTSKSIPPVYENATEAIGNTPMFRLNKFEKKYELQCEVYAKAEFMSVGGSVKDRISRRMVELAESQNIIKKGDVIIEATSGNTGIGLALICAARGYNMVVIMPEKMSAEKENTLKALGAKVIRTRTSAVWSDEDSHIVTAYRLCDEINSRCENTGVRAHLFDQYQSEGNVLAHYQETAQEILGQLNNQIDGFVAGAGTGGTMSGTARRIKEVVPTCRIFGVDPAGSRLHIDRENWSEGDLSPYEVEGIGYDFVPPVCHRDIVDEWVVVNDHDGFNRGREVIALEGLLVGGSCGLALEAALRVAKTMKAGQKLVVMLPDSIRNYLTKFASDSWMTFHGFKALPAGGDNSRTLADLIDKAGITVRKLRDLPQLGCKSTVLEAYRVVKDHDVGVVLDSDGSFLGLLTTEDVSGPLIQTTAKLEKPIDEIVVFKSFLPVSKLIGENQLCYAVDACREGTKNHCAPLVLINKANADGSDLHQTRLAFKELTLEEVLDCEFLTMSQQFEVLVARF